MASGLRKPAGIPFFPVFADFLALISLTIAATFLRRGMSVPSVLPVDLTDEFAAPAFKGCFTDMPALGEVSLVEVNNFHGRAPNGLVGVHEGAVQSASQAIPLRRSIRRSSCGH